MTRVEALRVTILTLERLEERARASLHHANTEESAERIFEGLVGVMTAREVATEALTLAVTMGAFPDLDLPIPIAPPAPSRN